LFNDPEDERGSKMDDGRRTKRSAVLVDRHPLWLEIVTQVLAKANIEVQARFVSSTAALERLEDLQTDLLITGLDHEPGDLGGVALIRGARDRVPGLKVVVLSAYDDRERIDLAFTAGADAYVVKTAAASDLLHAVHQAFEHSVYLPAVTSTAPMPGVGAPRDGLGLTPRELELLCHVAEGHSNAQLARMLWVTEQTVKFHLSNIYRKLNVNNRTEASRIAQVRGLLDPPAVAAAPDHPAVATAARGQIEAA
jgi:DNA-binding NarL/FixJ family response regulator